MLESGHDECAEHAEEQKGLLTDEKQKLSIGKANFEKIYFPSLLVAHVTATLLVILIFTWMMSYNAEDSQKQGFSWDSKSPKVFNWHPVFMTTGFCFCTTQAVLSYALPLPKLVNKMLHLIWHTLAWIFSAIGLYAVFKFHNENNIVNLYSSHSWFGMATIVLYGMEYLGGLAFLMPEKFISLQSRKLLLLFHRFLGIATLVFSFATVAMGILEKVTFNRTGPKKGSEYKITSAAIVVLMAW
eukprot:CAMPEP_0185282280 /NCGR_PEP_ID=MMETSP1359-20130426/67183_1 /TAXON_ID=552665 /ORGANISM="Bigelowiella longifila, Strain CCMP242" /LENGTH=241 /DNA_ID=CAMNT_0027877803 /DNA_START=348 /DNA_END=1070 /DNA_ORIENTATION=-